MSMSGESQVLNKRRKYCTWGVYGFLSAFILLGLIAALPVTFPDLKEQAPSIAGFLSYRRLSLLKFGLGGLSFFCLLTSGILLFICSGKDRLREEWKGAQCLYTEKIREAYSFLTSTQNRSYAIFLLLLFLAGATLRVDTLSTPLTSDEAITYTDFANGSLWNSASNYYIPNNHPFHSILLNGLRRVLPISRYTVRMPSVVAGILLLPVLMVFFHRVYGRTVGILSLPFVTFSVFLIYYSAQARGYMIQILLFYSQFLIAASVLKDERVNWAKWVPFTLFTLLGFYTMPSYAFCYGGVFGWYLLSVMFDPCCKKKWLMARIGLLSTTIAGVLVLIAFLPITHIYGYDLITNNHFTKSMPWDQFKNIGLKQYWEKLDFLILSYPAPLRTSLYVLFVLSPVMYIWKAPFRVPPQLAVFLIALGMVVLKRNSGFERTWIYLIPLFWASVTSSVVYLVEVFMARTEVRWTRWALPLVGIILSLGLFLHYTHQNRIENKLQRHRLAHPAVEPAWEALKGEINKDDFVQAGMIGDILKFYGIAEGTLTQSNFRSGNQNPVDLSRRAKTTFVFVGGKPNIERATRVTGAPAEEIETVYQDSALTVYRYDRQ